MLFTTPENDTAKLASALEAAITGAFGLQASVVVVSPGRTGPGSSGGNPYQDEPNHKLVHVVFLNAELPPDLLERVKAAEQASAAKGSRDAVAAIGPALYVHTPDGYGTSELAQVLFRIIGAPGKKTASPRRPGTGPRPPSCCP